MLMFTFAEDSKPLQWDTRLKIAIGAARGLAFLRTTEKQVIYCSFRTSNILLDGVTFSYFHSLLVKHFCLISFSPLITYSFLFFFF